MPAAFTETERARITERLLANGERLFTAQGLRKTSLEDLVSGTGIAKSSFYQFFAAKEALYLELMMRQSAAVKREVVDEALLSTEDVREGLRRFLHATLRRLESDPLYRRGKTQPAEMAAGGRRRGPPPRPRAGGARPRPAPPPPRRPPPRPAPRPRARPPAPPRARAARPARRAHESVKDKTRPEDR
jgi:AcrR family transcriptional regulator